MERFVISIRSLSFSWETAAPARCQLAHWLGGGLEQGPAHLTEPVRLASRTTGWRGQVKTGDRKQETEAGEGNWPDAPQSSETS